MVTPIIVEGMSVNHVVESPVNPRAGTHPVLMLHGWGANIDLLLPLGERLAASGFTVYMLDLPGFGHTPPPPAAWTVFDYARFAVAYMDSVGLERVNLFGHSFGGRLALILGADHPHRIDKIVLSDAAGVRPKTPLMATLRLKTYKAVRDGLNTVGLKGLSESLRAGYNARYGSTDFNAVSGVMRETFVNVVNQDLLPHAARVQASTLLLWGDQDQDTPLDQGKLLERTIPDAGLVVYEGAGHYAYLERASEAARVMAHFWGSDA